MRPSPLRAALGAAEGGVGDQAVIEGGMIRGPARWAVTVRRADGRLATAASPIALGSVRPFFRAGPSRVARRYSWNP